MANEPTRIYLDNAATSWPKIPAAAIAAHEFTLNCGATTGRGSYRSAETADAWLVRGRKSLAKLIGVDDSRDIAFATSGTHALNAVLRGLLRSGDYVATTTAEHNSVLRPLEGLRKELNLTVETLPVDVQGRSWPPTQDHALAPKPTPDGRKWLVIGHSSNVTGAVTDLHAWCQFAHDNGWKVILDASQTIGYIPIDLATTPVHALASSGHKGLRALAGTGFIYCCRELQTDFEPILRGGTGRKSESLAGGHDWPDAIEAGNLNLPGIVSMAIAAEHTIESTDQWKPAFGLLHEALRKIDGLEMIGADAEMKRAIEQNQRTPVLSLRAEGWSPHDLATVLNDHFSIECRAGLHCAALVHDAIGTRQDSGTLRLSSGHATTAEEVQAVATAFRTVLGT